MARRSRSTFQHILLLTAAGCISLLLVNAAVDDENVPPTAFDEPDEATVTKGTIITDDDKPFYPPEPQGDYFLYEPFRTSDLLGKSWYLSTTKKEGVEEDLAKYEGQWQIEEAKLAHLRNDLGLVVKSKAKHHAIATRLARPFTFSSEALVLQFDLKFQEGQDCGGGYVKLLSSGQEQDLHLFMDKTPFTIMFGPDKCGLDSKLHFIIKIRNPRTGEIEEKKASQPKEKIEKFISDKLTHLYTLVLQPDSKFSIYIDQKLVHSGSLLNDFDPPINPPKEIKDPDARKPADWNDVEFIADPNEVKPASWNDDRLIPDKNADKPEDWDDEMDGVWEPPKVENPSYKGDWTPKQIKNPGYQGPWKHPMIANPNYNENPKPFQSLAPIAAVGIELWTMSADIMFDNFIITSDKAQADRLAKDTWSLKYDREHAGSGVVSGATSTISKWFDYAKSHPYVLALFLAGIGVPIAFIIMSLVGRSRESAQRDKARQQQQKRGTGRTGSDDEQDGTVENRRPGEPRRAAGAAEDDDDEDDDDELLGNAATSQRSAATSSRQTTTSLRSNSPTASRLTNTSQTRSGARADADLDGDESPPSLEGEGDEEETSYAAATRRNLAGTATNGIVDDAEGDDDEEEGAEEDEELLAAEPPAEAAGVRTKVTGGGGKKEVTTVITTKSVEMTQDSAATADAGSGLRARARRPRREE